MITLAQFCKAIPCHEVVGEVWHPYTVVAMAEWEINEPHRIAGFLAQCAHESRNFTRFTENLNYSVQGLANTWPSRFAVDKTAKVKVPNDLARKLGRTTVKPCDQVALANYVYGSRGGNRSGTNDGWNYRGRGPKQITFYDNYYECGLALGLDLIKRPDLLLEPAHGIRAAAWYWASRGCNSLMDKGDWIAVTKAINGGLIGYEDGNDWGIDDRVEHLALANEVLGVS